MFGKQQVLLQSNLIRPDLGYRQVIVPNGVRSFSQQGDFFNARRAGPDVMAMGPRPAFSDARLVKRSWSLTRRLVILASNGQSNSVGADSNQSGVSDTVEPFMQLPPIPDALRAFKGGFSPTQDGVDSTGVLTFIDATQYQAPLVPGAENINTGRTPGSEVNRQMWSSAFGQTVAAALNAGNQVLVINVGHGGTSFSEDVQGAAFLSNTTWSGGIATLTFTTTVNIPVGATITVTSAGGYNGTYIVLTSSATVVTVTLAVDGGAFVPGGFAQVPKAPMVNLYNMVTYAANTLAPAMGLTPYFACLMYNGNEANDGLATIANFLTEVATLRTMANDLELICAQAERAWLCWAQVNYPVSDWHNTDLSLFGCASNVTLGALAASLTSTNKMFTLAQYSSVHAAAAPCIHYGVQGHFDNGERAGNLFLDAVTGGDPQPPYILSGEDILTRVTTSTTINGTYSRSMIVTTNPEITDPGNKGFQTYSGVLNLSGASGGAGYSTALSSAAISGTALTLTLSGTPTNAWGNFVGYAYNNATVYTLPNRLAITNIVYNGLGVSTTGVGLTGNTTAPTAPTLTVNTVGDTIFGFAALEATTMGTGDSDTTNGTWSTPFTAIASTGTTTTSQALASQWKTVTGTGAQTYNISLGAGRNYAANSVIVSYANAITNAGSATSIVSGATLPVTAITASVGDFLLVGVASDNQGAAGISSVSGISDTGSNVWTTVNSTNRTAGSVAGDGTTLTIFSTTLTTALTAGTVTISFSPNTTSKGAVIYRITPNGSTTATYTTVSPHGISVGSEVTIINNVPVGYDIVPGVACLAGTTGSTIVMPLAVNPGPFVSGGTLAINGLYDVGQVGGARGTLQAATVDHYSLSSGIPLARFAAQQFVQVDVYPSSKSIVTMLTETGL